MWIRNSLGHALRQLKDFNQRSVPGNLVYEHPSIVALATFTSQLALNSTTPASTENKVRDMVSMVEKYRHQLPKHSGSVVSPAKDVVLVTGTTGSLGTALLAQLVASDDVGQIFAFNRTGAKGVAVTKRQENSLKAQGLDTFLLNSSKITFVEGDTSQPTLGIPSDTLETVCLLESH